MTPRITKAQAREAKKPTLHIYTARMQPAHNYVDRTGPGRPVRYRCSPNAILICDFCGARRRARNILVQVHYDAIFTHCKDGCPTKAGKRKAKR